MAGLLIQPEGLLRRRSISSALVIAVENKPGDGLPSKRSFYCKSMLDFIETRVCSLVYKFAFFIDCVSHLHFAHFQGEMAMSVRGCLDLVPDWTPAVWILMLAVYGKNGPATRSSSQGLAGTLE